MNPFDLTGKVAIVTGAGSPSGIGFASAALLTELGAAVLVTSTTDRVQERAMELRGVGREVASVAADLTDPAGAQTIVDVAVARWDHIDILINNAGMTSVSQPTSEGGELEGMSLDTWQDGLRRNLDTTSSRPAPRYPR